MTIKMQLYLEPEVHWRARERAMQLGVSLAEYVRRLLAHDLERPERAVDPSSLFNLGNSGGSNIARQKDSMIGEAVPRRAVQEGSGVELVRQGPEESVRGLALTIGPRPLPAAPRG